MKHRHLTFFAALLTLTVATLAGAQEPPATQTPETAAEEAHEAAHEAEQAAEEAHEAAHEAEQAAHEASPEEGDTLELTDPDIQKTLVMTGTTVNASPDEIIVETADGHRVFLIDAEDLHPEPIAEGQTVTVWYVERNDVFYATDLKVGNHLNPGHLPQTASYQPMIALASLLGFAAAFAAWRLRRSFLS